MSSTVQVGDRFGGRFEVAEVLSGGMSLVYVVVERRGPKDRRMFALKTLRDEFLDDPGRRRRFQAECHLWVRLGKHPNTVRAFSVEEFDGRPYVVLEYVPDGDLRRWIGTPRLDLPRVLRFGIQFCLGMEQALRAGLVSHRDIKPANLLIDGGETLKITDFGLVRLRDEILAIGLDRFDGPIPLEEPAVTQPIVWTDPKDRAADPGRCVRPPPIEPVDVGTAADAGRPRVPPGLDSTVDYVTPSPGLSSTSAPDLTRSGLLLGTLPYMAPEQFRDPRRVDVRADLYSFGVVLFEMLTARRPFRGETLAMLRRQHEHYAPPSVAPAIPRRYRREAEQIDDLVRRCLQKDPSDRYASITELRQDLMGTLRKIDRKYDPHGR